MEGVMTIVANWGAKGQEAAHRRLQEAHRRAVDDAGQHLAPTATSGSSRKRWRRPAAADRKKVAEAIRAMDTTDGPAQVLPGRTLKFDENGPPRRRRARDRPVAERRADDGLSGRPRRWRSRIWSKEALERATPR